MELSRLAVTTLLVLALAQSVVTVATAADAVWTGVLVTGLGLMSRKRRCAFDGAARHASDLEQIALALTRESTRPKLYVAWFILMAIGGMYLVGHAASVTAMAQMRLRLHAASSLHLNVLTSAVVPALWRRHIRAGSHAESAWVSGLLPPALCEWLVQMLPFVIFAYSVTGADFEGGRLCVLVFGVVCVFCRANDVTPWLLHMCALTAVAWAAWWLWLAPRLARHSPLYETAVRRALGKADPPIKGKPDRLPILSGEEERPGSLYGEEERPGSLSGTDGADSRDAARFREAFGLSAVQCASLRALADLAYNGLCAAGRAPRLRNMKLDKAAGDALPYPPRAASAAEWPSAPRADCANFSLAAVLGARPNSGTAARSLADLVWTYMAAPRPLQLHTQRLCAHDTAGWHLGPHIRGGEAVRPSVLSGEAVGPSVLSGEAGPAHVRYRELLDGVGAPVLLQFPRRGIPVRSDRLADLSMSYSRNHMCVHCAPAGPFPLLDPTDSLEPERVTEGAVPGSAAAIGVPENEKEEDDVEEEKEKEEAAVREAKATCAAVRLTEDNLPWLATELPGVYYAATGSFNFAEPRFFCDDCFHHPLQQPPSWRAGSRPCHERRADSRPCHVRRALRAAAHRSVRGLRQLHGLHARATIPVATK